MRPYSTHYHLQKLGPHRVRVTLSSFRATTRNPGIPGHGIPQDARAVRPYSTHCHLQKLDPASSAG